MGNKYIIISDDTPIETDVPELTEEQEREIEDLINNTITENSMT